MVEVNFRFRRIKRAESAVIIPTKRVTRQTYNPKYSEWYGTRVRVGAAVTDKHTPLPHGTHKQGTVTRSYRE